MTTEKFSYPQAERQRKLQALTFQEGQILSRDLPKDTVLKSIQLRLSGSVVTTFGSGTPVADAFSTFDNLVSRIDVIVDGSRTVKSVQPKMMRTQQLYSSGVIAERLASAGAAIATDNLPTATAAFQYGTTGQYSTAAESISVPFEHVYCAPGMGREATWLNLKGVASAEVRLTCGSFSALLGFGNTAPVVYSSSTFIVDISTREAQDVPPQVRFSDWKQVTQEKTFSAETSDSAIDINRGNKLSGILILARNGAAGTATTATGKLASNLAVTKMSLRVNGQSDIKSTTFKELQAENRAMYGVKADFASNVSLLDGFAHMNFLARQDISTALDIRPPMVDNCQLVISTNTAANVSYTNPVSITIMSEEIVEPR